MSKKMLLELNGSSRGAFHRWLRAFDGEPRIAWYPSAGEDFRDTLYLHREFAKHRPGSRPDPPAPDIFLHTDYFPWGSSTFLDTATVRDDGRTTIRVKSIEQLPHCVLPLDPEIVDFPQGSAATGRVVFLELSVTSDVLGTFTAPVVYAFVENAAFCAMRALPLGARFSHIVHVRYGGGLGGGGKSSGAWLPNILGRVQCEVFLTDGHLSVQSGDERVHSLYWSLARQVDRSELQRLRILPGRDWSDHGDITWSTVVAPPRSRD